MNSSPDPVYERLLSSLSQRLGAARAELVLHAGAGAPLTPGTHNSAAAPVEHAIYEGEHEIGRLRVIFAADASPGAAGRAQAQLAAALAALLIEEHRRMTRGPLRQAGGRMLTVTEEELQRIILDIHDGPVQKLFAAAAQLALLQSQIDALPEPMRATLGGAARRAAQLTESAQHDIRATFSSFRMAEFQNRPLPEVLRGLALQHESLTGNHVELAIDGPIPPVSLPVKIALYRVLQESLSNAYRHAGVDRQAVRLSASDGWVALEIADQGRGFEPPPLEGPGAAEYGDHIGLRGMRERMHLVGGQLQVISRPGQGTRVIVQVPSDA